MAIKSESYIRLLLKFTKTKSEPLICAVIDHILHGKTQQECVLTYGVSQSAISSKKSRLLELDELVDNALEIKMDLSINEAIARVSKAKVTRDSVHRKLIAGSDSVSLEQLNYWESELSAAQEELAKLGRAAC